MIFADFAAGESVFVDANTFVYHFTAHPRFGPACSQFLQRIALQELTASGSNLQLEWHYGYLDDPLRRRRAATSCYCRDGQDGSSRRTRYSQIPL